MCSCTFCGWRIRIFYDCYHSKLLFLVLLILLSSRFIRVLSLRISWKKASKDFFMYNSSPFLEKFYLFFTYSCQNKHFSNDEKWEFSRKYLFMTSKQGDWNYFNKDWSIWLKTLETFLTWICKKKKKTLKNLWIEEFALI